MNPHKQLEKLANKEKAVLLQRYFKTGKGEYAEGDIFLGLTVPQIRKLASQYSSLSLEETESLLQSKIHEKRLLALFILIHHYKKADEKKKKEIINLYLANTRYINNWDLVDCSSPYLLGDYLLNKDREILYKLAKSSHLWEKRISIISTAAFIKNNQFEDTLKIAEILLKDKHDLIHKAVGWMLRELGKKKPSLEEKFLKKYYKTMPRTMLRYSIEKFPEEKRRFYLKK